MGCKIAGTAKALPKLKVTNDDLSRIVETSDEWIVERTGIHERTIALDETCTDLAAASCSEALARAGVAPNEIDLLVCMTISPDTIVPSQAALIRARLGLKNAVAFDLNAACSGCIYGLEVAATMIEASVVSEGAGAPLHHRRNPLRRALVVGVERLSRITDWTDRATCVLFGDGSGAVVLEWDDEAPGILASFLKNTDDDSLCLTTDADYDLSTFPFGEVSVESPSEVMGVRYTDKEGNDIGLAPHHPFIRMNGQKVFKFATAAIVEAAQIVCERAGVSMDDIACIVPHQANDRIIRYAAKKLGVPYERWQVSIGEVGNTSASSVLMALADAYESGRIHPGDKVLLVGFGGGLTSGALLFEA